MTDHEPQDLEAAPQEPSSDFPNLAKGFVLALMMIPIGGCLLMFSGNAVFHGWLEIAPKMTFGQACGSMTLAWLVRFFMYR